MNTSKKPALCYRQTVALVPPRLGMLRRNVLRRVVGAAGEDERRNRDVYEFHGSSGDTQRSAQRLVEGAAGGAGKLTPVSGGNSSSKATQRMTQRPAVSPTARSQASTATTAGGRRARVPYSSQEERNLLHGVRQLGRFWSQILHTYDFHPQRTAVDLKDKYKVMMKKATSSQPRSLHSDNMEQNRLHSLTEDCGSEKENAGAASGNRMTVAAAQNPSSISDSVAAMKTLTISAVDVRRARLPFTIAEDRRLRRGVKIHGYSWATILAHFSFAPGRTASELRERWRSLHQ